MFLKIIMLIIAIAHFSNWITWKIDFRILRRVREFGKPFNCVTCFSWWLGLIVFGVWLCSWWAVPYAVITSLVADLIEDRLNKFD